MIHSTDSLQDKLPKPHWILRYSFLFIFLIIGVLGTTLYMIKVPNYLQIELFAKKDSGQLIAICPPNKWLEEQESLSIILENGQQYLFQIKKFTHEKHTTHLTLASEQLDAKRFLKQEYISIGKVALPSQPLIFTLFPNN